MFWLQWCMGWRKLHGMSITRDTEKEAFVACARSFCRKTTCTMAITMGRIPVSLKAEAQDELIDEKKEMLSEIKRFSRETVTKKILEQREKENPSGC